MTKNIVFDMGGVLIRWDNYGTGHHIYVKNCDIHDVNVMIWDLGI